MSDVDAIALGLQERLNTVPGFAGYDVWPDTVNPPAGLVMGPTHIQDLSLGCNSAIYSFDVVIVVPMSAGLAEAQRRVRPYLARTGDQSVFLALEGDKTLGGACQTLIVDSGVQLLGDFNVGDIALFGAMLTVSVYS